MQLVEFDLNFTDTHWVCTHQDASFTADSLEQLDLQIKKYLIEKYKNGNVKVKMYFDFDRFPTWMRQYMAHYFNRELTYQL